MTDKELLYAQDALGHYRHLLEMCTEMKQTCCQEESFACEFANELTSGVKDLNSLLKRYGG